VNKTPLNKKIGLLLLMVIPLSACSGLGVKPWQRDILSKQEMTFGDSSMDAAFDDHIYFSKEASSGGRSFSGGGCGCN
jgi:hypothetical protein